MSSEKIQQIQNIVGLNKNLATAAILVSLCFLTMAEQPDQCAELVQIGVARVDITPEQLVYLINELTQLMN